MHRGIGRQRPPRGARQRRIAIALAILTAAAAFIAWTPRLPHSGPTGIAWRSDSTTPRLRWTSLAGLPPLSIASFATISGRMYVADRVASRILGLTRTEDGIWAVDSILADRPTLQTPVSIAATADSNLVVYDAPHVVHWIDLKTGAVSSIRASMPCDLTEGQLTVPSASRLLLAGRCPIGVGDTLAAVLLASADSGRHFDAVTALPLFGRDGSWGTVLYAKRFVLPMGDSVSFATGVDTCDVPIAPHPAAALRRVCISGFTRYSAREPADFGAVRAVRETMGMSRGNATDWPRLLPLFLDRVRTRRGLAMVRLVSGDSLELQLHNLGPQPDSPLLVAPLNGFRGCAGDYCLWFKQLGSQTMLELVDVASLTPPGQRSRRTSR